MKSGGGCFLVRNGTADTMVKEFLENVEVRLRKVGYTGCFLLKKYLCREVCWSERYFNEMDVFGWRAVPPTRWWKNFKNMLNIGWMKLKIKFRKFPQNLEIYVNKEVCWIEGCVSEMDVFRCSLVPRTRWLKNFLNMFNWAEWMSKIVVF